MSERKRYSIVYAPRKSLINDDFFTSFEAVHKVLKRGEEVTVAIETLFQGRWDCEGYKQVGKDKKGICWTQRSIAYEY